MRSLSRWNLRLIPVATFVLVAGISVALWLGSEQHEREAIGLKSALAAEQLASHIQHDIDARLELAQFVAADLQHEYTHLHDEFLDAARGITARFDSIAAINWIDADGIIRYVVPQESNQQALNKSIADHPIAAKYYQEAKRTGGLRITPQLDLYQGGRGFALYVPVDRLNPSLGVVNLAIRTDSLFHHQVPERVLEQYTFEILEGDQPVFQHGDPVAKDRKLAEAVEQIRLANRTWTLRVRPNRTTILAMSSSLDEFFFVVGIMLATGLFFLLERQFHTSTKLRTSLAAMRAITENVPGVVYIYDSHPEGRDSLVSVGPGMQDLLGPNGFKDFKHEFASLRARIHPDDLPVLSASIQEGQQSGELVDVEYRIMHDNGDYSWVRAQSRPMYLPEGVTRWHVVAIVIDQKKAAQQELLASQRQYRSVVEDLPNLVCRFKPDTTLVFINENYARYFGKTVPELVGTSFLDLIPRSEQAAVVEHLAQLTPDNPSRVMEHKVIAADGSIRWQQWHDRAMFDDESNLVEFQSIGLDITEAKLDRHERDELQIAIENAMTGISAFDLEGRFTSMNEGYATMLGGQPADFVGRHWQEFVVESDIPIGVEAIERMLVRGRAEAVLRAKRLDGSSFWKRILLVARVETGEHVGQYCFMRDVNDRIHAEQQVRESESKLRAVVDAAEDPIFMKSIDGKYMLVNKAMERVCGVPADEIVGRRERDLFQTNSKDAVCGIDKRVLQGNIEEAETVQMIRGTERAFHVIKVPLRGADGSITGLCGIARDITDRRRAAQQLASRESWFRAIFECVPDSVVLLDQRGRILDMNHAGLALIGAKNMEHAGSIAFESLALQDDVKAIRSAVTSVFEADSNRLQFRVATPESRIRWLDAHLVPLRESDGRVSAALVVARDFTNQKRTQERQTLMMRELDHRVKNNLASVMALADQTAASANSLSDFQFRFAGRLGALSRTHDALASAQWDGVRIDDAVRLTVMPHADPYDRRVIATGPSILLPARASAPICMTLHELATNAVKYGALSTMEGRINIDWKLDDDAVTIRWTERNGPTPGNSPESGFGTVLIRGFIEHELGGQVALDFTDQGLECTMVIPMKSHSKASVPVGSETNSPA